MYRDSCETDVGLSARVMRAIMTRSSRILSGASIGLALICTSSATAQIDHRVNQGNASAAGRLLDNNPQVGSSGFNITRPGLNDPGARANAIITGNVTGLAGFKGYSPVVQNNQFRGSLPSAGLSGFQARSVGLRDVLSGNTYESNFFYGQPETFSDLGFIRAGLNQPGSPTVQSTNFIPPNPATIDYKPSSLLQDLRPAEDRRVNVTTPNVTPRTPASEYGIKLTPAGTGLDRRDIARTLAPYRDAMGSSIFGSPPPPSRPSALSSTSVLPSSSLPLTPGTTTPEVETLSRGGLLSEDAALRRIDTSVPPPDQSPLATPVGAADGAAVLTTDGSPLMPVAEGLAADPGQPPAALGADRFADLYSAVGAAQSMGVTRLGFDAVSVQPVSAAPADAIGQTPSAAELQRGGLLRKPSEGFLELSTAARWAAQTLEHPLTTFAGRHQNRLNEYIRAGEMELQAGRYYDAARYFELASTIDPLNPLPLLARGHALAAAGDYRSAVRLLMLGIERFPQIAAFRIDLPGLVGRLDVFDVRRADLESKLEKVDSPELRFLLGYLELYSGLPEEGMRNLRLAAEASDPQSIIGMFADLVTGQRELPPLAP